MYVNLSRSIHFELRNILRNSILSLTDLVEALHTRYNLSMKKWFAVTLAGLTLAASFLVGLEAIYAEQVLPGVSIEGRSFAGYNRTALQSELDKLVESYNQTGITFVEGEKTHHAALSDVGISYHADQAVAQAFGLSHKKVPGLGALHLVLAKLFRLDRIHIPTTIDAAVQADYFENTIYTAFGQAPVDASLDTSTDTIGVIPAQNGLWVEDTRLLKNIGVALYYHQPTVTVPLTVKRAEVDESDLTQAIVDARALLSRNITLLAGPKKIVAERADIASWLFIKPEDDQLRARFDPEKVKKYLTEKVVPKVEQRGQGGVIDPNDGVIKASRDTIKVKIDDSLTTFMDALAGPDQDTTIKLAVDIKTYSSTTVDPQEGSTPCEGEGRCIKINLTKQRMYLYEGQTFVNSFRVSTGKWSTPTPIGTFAIHNKIEVANSREYNLKMPKWNAITANGKYGIHGLPYRGNWVEGQNHIGTPVSHGCIRLGKGNDQLVFEWAPIGTPVSIYK